MTLAQKNRLFILGVIFFATLAAFAPAKADAPGLNTVTEICPEA